MGEQARGALRPEHRSQVCITLIDAATVSAVRSLGGIRAIAISHPHYYSSMVEWSRAFDAPVYCYVADRRWVMRPDERIEFWDGESKPRIVSAVDPFDFDRIYGAWWDRNVESDAKQVVRRSAERYKRHLQVGKLLHADAAPEQRRHHAS